jgi:hypothetical protein
MTREAGVFTQWLRHATGIRLTLFLPLLLMMLTVSVGLWTIYLTTGTVGVGRATPRALVDIQAVRRSMFLVAGVGGGLALLLGAAVAYSIDRERPLGGGSRAPGEGGRDSSRTG